jgi:hypothetical protein
MIWRDRNPRAEGNPQEDREPPLMDCLGLYGTMIIRKWYRNVVLAGVV